MKFLNITDPTFKDLFFGGLSIAEWQFQSMLIMIGILLRIFIRAKNRRNSNITFNLKLWVVDTRNWATVFFSIILTYILIRFYSEYKVAIEGFIPAGFTASIYFIMFGLGFYFHKIGWWLSKQKLINKN
jgi:hypothetical protein